MANAPLRVVEGGSMDKDKALAVLEDKRRGAETATPAKPALTFFPPAPPAQEAARQEAAHA